MLLEITGVTSGTSPYNIYVCDPSNTSCFFIATVGSFLPPIEINTESYFPNSPAVYLKIIDGTFCEKLILIECGVYTFQDSNVFIFMDGDINVFQNSV